MSQTRSRFKSTTPYRATGAALDAIAGGHIGREHDRLIRGDRSVGVKGPDDLPVDE
ncbi:MAG: hypothetical protein Q7U89_08395 [Coriobacteriia bacterium]|nr:hypothetical protein [Coriobacteriia bacterium]